MEMRTTRGYSCSVAYALLLLRAAVLNSTSIRIASTFVCLCLPLGQPCYVVALAPVKTCFKMTHHGKRCKNNLSLIIMDDHDTRMSNCPLVPILNMCVYAYIPSRWACLIPFDPVYMTLSWACINVCLLDNNLCLRSLDPVYVRLSWACTHTLPMSVSDII